MAETYDIGDEVRLTASFTQSDVAVDPSTVSLTVQLPDGTSTTYTYAGSTITRSSAGHYMKDVTPSQAGIHRYRWTSTSNGAASEEGWFEVRPRLVS